MCSRPSGMSTRSLLVRNPLSQNLRSLANSELDQPRVVLPGCGTTRYPRRCAKPIPLGYTLSEAPADKLQPAQQVLHQYVHNFWWAGPMQHHHESLTRLCADITFCGDWAGNSYATSGCPGTCAERLQDPKNFEVRGTHSSGYLG